MNRLVKKQHLIIVIWALNGLLLFLFFLPPANTAGLVRFFGRLHPLLLHFPIVLLILAFIFEGLGIKKDQDYRPMARIMLWSGALLAAVTAIAGLLLSAEGGYTGESFVLHKWLGLSTSILPALLINLEALIKSKKLYMGLYGSMVLILVATGHFGASLTHGADFLTDAFEERTLPTLDSEAPVFANVIQPILEQKCVSCHNPDKAKGGLLLDSEANLLKGGDSGALLTAGNLPTSLLIHRVSLPLEEEEHMPPKGKMQLSPTETQLLSWWIENGASFTQQVSGIAQKDPIQTAIRSYFEAQQPLDIDFASPELISSLNQGAMKVTTIAEDQPYLSVYLGQQKALSLKQLKPLRKIDEQVYSLDLGNSQVTKSIIKELSKLPNLHRLYLDNTELSDAMIKPLSKLKKLEYLNLYNTKVTRKGIEDALELPALKQLFIWQTNIENEDIIALQTAFPNVKIDGGLPENSEFSKSQLAPPNINFSSTFFKEELTIDVDYSLSGTSLLYQVDNGPLQPVQNGQVTLNESAKLSFVAKKEGWDDSEPTTHQFIKVASNQISQMDLKHAPKGEYLGNGAATLFDLYKGSENFRDGRWLGFNGDDLIIDIELEKVQNVHSVFISTLDDIGSWIFPPRNLEVWGGGADGKLVKLSTLSLTPPEGPEPKHMLIHQLAFEEQPLKRLSIRAKNYGNLPEWHPGKNTPAWLFIDEIVLN